jgi:ABC-type Na+ efflux pump, permease component
MRSKLNYLIGVSLGRKIKTKWFLISQIVLLVLIIGVVNIDSIISAFGGDFNKATKIYVVDETDKSYDIFKESLDLNAKTLYGEDNNRFEFKKIDTVEEIREKVSKDGGIIVQIMPSKDNTIEINLISKESVDMYDFSLINSSANSVKVVLTMEELGLTSTDYLKIMSDVVINRSLISENLLDEEESTDMIMNTVFPIFILPVFMLSIILVQMIGAEVNDEKTTKAMEIIISNVSPKTHFFAKVIAGNIFVLTQGALLIGFSGLALLVKKLIGPVSGTSAITSDIMSAFDMVMKSSLADKLIYIIPLTLILIVLTFIAYSLVAGILASMTTTIEDYQQVQTPIMLISVFGYYLAIMAGLFKGAVFIKLLSFVPFISAILCPSLLILGQIGIIEVIISIIIMIVTNYLLIKYGLKIYKVGILNYSSSGLWKRMFKALKD